MAPLTLYYAPQTISVAVLIALNELELAHDLIRVDFASGEQTKPPFLALNPKGRVPTLMTPQGPLTETGALLDYLHALAPDAGLIPADPMAAAKVRELMYYIASTMHVAHAHKLRGARWADRDESFADMRAKVPQTMAACCLYLEDTLAFAPYCCGERMTAADIYLFVITTWLAGDGVALADYPKLSALYDLMAQRPAVRAAAATGALG